MVTGANYLLEFNSQAPGSKTKKILIDCGLVQGEKFADKLNYENWKFNPKEIDYVLITHSHIDHIGRLPKLYKDGFSGKIYSTSPTKDFAELALVDSANLLRREAEALGKSPLYEANDVVGLMNYWTTVEYYQRMEIFSNIYFTLHNAGHILGSSFIEIEAEGKKIIFSGDMGNPPVPFLKPPDIIEKADFLVIESAYGNKTHKEMDKRRDILEDIIEQAAQNNGVLLIPAFAMERTQQMLFEMNDLVEKNKIPRIPIFIDSPLALKLTSVYEKHENYFNQEALNIIQSGDQIFNFPGLELTFTKEQSKKINKIPPPKIIISGSGMMQGGRILYHLANYLPDPNNILLIVSYQADGSLGRKILDGAKEVEIFGQKIPVKAQIIYMDSYSAHADQNQLLAWIFPMRQSLKKVFIVQGEKESADDLALKIRDTLAINTDIPNIGDSVDL